MRKVCVITIKKCRVYARIIASFTERSTGVETPITLIRTTKITFLTCIVQVIEALLSLFLIRNVDADRLLSEALVCDVCLASLIQRTRRLRTVIRTSCGLTVLKLCAIVLTLSATLPTENQDYGGKREDHPDGDM
jgi:hypothetical protein